MGTRFYLYHIPEDSCIELLGWVKIRTRLYNENENRYNPKVDQKSDLQPPLSWVVRVHIIHAFLLICCSQITSKNNGAQHIKISRNQVIIKCKQWRYQLKHPFPPALWAINLSDFISTRSQLFLFCFKLFCTLRLYTYIHSLLCISHQTTLAL